MTGITTRAVCLCVSMLLAAPVVAGNSEKPIVGVDGVEFESWQEYINSDHFRQAGGRCATPSRAERQEIWGWIEGGDPSDCSSNETNPLPAYDPSTRLFEIPVVVHIIMDSACSQGQISDELAATQIDILNEDFLAWQGSNGGSGTDVQIRFVLATEGPDGKPTNGITRDCNTTWFNDGGGYYDTLNWDPFNYLNIYTNTASGALGYVPFLPADSGGGLVGLPSDRVVVLWSSFGREAPIGPPYDQGRTTTHEVGHYLGLEHTFNGGCGAEDPPACYSEDDLICDTNPEASPTFSPCALGDKVTCGSVDPSDNYMDYSDDLCMLQFTPEQSKRERCTLEHYRGDLLEEVTYILEGPSPGLPGQPSTWEVRGATPGSTSYFVFGADSGTSDVPGCPGAKVNVAQAKLIGVEVADGSGVAALARDVPEAASGRTVRFQVVESATCTISNLITYTFP